MYVPERWRCRGPSGRRGPGRRGPHGRSGMRRSTWRRLQGRGGRVQGSSERSKGTRWQDGFRRTKLRGGECVEEQQKHQTLRTFAVFQVVGVHQNYTIWQNTKSKEMLSRQHNNKNNNNNRSCILVARSLLTSALSHPHVTTFIKNQWMISIIINQSFFLTNTFSANFLCFCLWHFANFLSPVLKTSTL